MIRRLVFQLLLLLPLALGHMATTEEYFARMRQREIQWANAATAVARSDVAEMLKKYEGDWESFIKKSNQPLFIQDPTDDQPSTILPNDIWFGKVLPQVDDFWTMLAIGRVSKALNYVTRKYCHDAMIQGVDEPLATELVRNGDFNLTANAMKYMWELLRSARKNSKDRNELTRVRLNIYNRTKDLGVVQKAYYYCNNTASFPMVPEAEEIVQGLRVVKGSSYHPSTRDIERQKETQYIWLPDEDDGLPLLLRFDPRTVAAMLGQNLCTFRTMFFPHLLAQYILPIYRKEEGMAAEILEPYRALMRPHGFFEYFHYLYRALFYLDGDLRKASSNRSSRLYKIAEFLKSIGFDTSAFNYCRPAAAKWGEEEYQVEEEMWSIIRVAQHWKLNWKKIAKKTQHWCQLSKRIVEGEIVDGLHPWEPITPHDVFKVAFWNETEVVRPTYKIVDGFLVLDAVEEKRKRTLERNRELQQDRKRRKLEAKESNGGEEDAERKGRRKTTNSTWAPMQMYPNHPIAGFNDQHMAPIQHPAPALPQLRLDHAAFLAPPAAHPAPIQQQHQATAQPMQQAQPGTMTHTLTFTGTPEQVRKVKEILSLIGRHIVERRGAAGHRIAQNENQAPINAEAAPLQENTQIDQQAQIPAQEDQQPMIIATNDEQTQAPQMPAAQPLESPFFISPTELNDMDFDRNTI